MRRMVGLGLAVMALSAQAQGRVDSSGGVPMVEKPAPSRFYGTAGPPAPAGGPPPVAPAAPPKVFGQPAPMPVPVAPAPPVVQPGPRPLPPGPPAFAPPVHARPPVYVPPPVHARPPVYVPPPVHARPPIYVPPPRTHVDVVIGAPIYRPWYGPRPVYPGWGPPAVVLPPPVVVPPAVVVPAPPPAVVYVERPVPIEDAAPLPGYWYWCAEPEGWYPNVVECPQGWLPVPPRAER